MVICSISFGKKPQGIKSDLIPDSLCSSEKLELPKGRSLTLLYSILTSWISGKGNRSFKSRSMTRTNLSRHPFVQPLHVSERATRMRLTNILLIAYNFHQITLGEWDLNNNKELISLDNHNVISFTLISSKQRMQKFSAIIEIVISGNDLLYWSQEIFKVF